MKKKIKLLSLLEDRKFTSGQRLADQLGLSRATISQWIKQLEGMGLDFCKIRGRGYRLVTPIQFLNRQELLEAMSSASKSKLKVIDVAAEAVSTNQIAMNATYGPREWKLFSAEYQTKGRGRRGKDWLSPPGANLLFSLGCRDTFEGDLLYISSLLVGVAIADSITEVTGLSVRLKWPNDVYIGKKKVAGVLCELKGSPLDEATLIIGIGVNVLHAPELASVDTVEATSLLREAGRGISRERLLATIVDKTLSMFDHATNEGSRQLLERWSEYDLLKGKQVVVQKGTTTTQGKALGIDSKGQLIVQGAEEAIIKFNGGEVSVRW